MAVKVKKKKKIIKKKVGQSVSPVVENESTPVDNLEKEEKLIDLPESLSSEKFKWQIDKIKKEEAIRDKEKASFIVPEGYQIQMVIGHSHIPLEEDSKLAIKEIEFWKKYKPERYYEIIRHGYYVTYIISRPANKTEQAENMRKKRPSA